MPRPKLINVTAIRTLDEVAAMLGTTRQYVSAVEKKALKKMRAEWERLDRIEAWKVEEAKEKFRCNSRN